MHWNPIESAKSALKDVKHAASDGFSASKKFYEDAYETGKTATKGVGTVVKDAAVTGFETAREASHGDLKGSANALSHGVGKVASDLKKTDTELISQAAHTLHDGAKGALKVGGDLNHLAIDTASIISPHGGDALRLTEAFGAAAINSALLQPIDAVSQLASAGVKKATGYELPKLNLHITPDVEGLGTLGKVATIAGTAAGYIAPVLLTGGATSALAGLAGATKAVEATATVGEIAANSSKAASMGMTAGKEATAMAAGKEAASTAPSKVSNAMTKFVESPQKSTADSAAAGFLFTPGKNGNIDLRHRIEAAAVNGATLGTLNATSSAVRQGAESVAGPAIDGVGVVSATETSVRHVSSGVTGGVAGEEMKSVVENHRLATPAQLFTAAHQMIVKDASAASTDNARLRIAATIK